MFITLFCLSLGLVFRPYITLAFAQNGEKNTEKDVDVMSDNVLFPLSSLTGSKEQDLAGDLTPKAPTSS